MIEEDLITYLYSGAAVTALVGQRVTPLRMDQGADLPAITVQRIDGPRVRSLTGPSGLAHPRFQLDCWGSTYASVKAVATAVRQRLDGYRGLMGSTTVGGVSLESDQDDFEPDTGLYRVSMDFIIWHKE
jgi:hypothetical protein